jgi:CRP-like cAMP-binding protein
MSAVPQKLLAIARPVSFLKGAQLVRQGEASRGAFIVRQGEVEAQVALPGGGRLAVAALGEGEMFGEMALIERGVCSASVVAKTNVDGWFIERSEFRALVASREPAALELQREISRVLAAKLRALNAKVQAHPAAEQQAADFVFTDKERTRPAFDWRAFLPILPFFEGFDADALDELVAGCRVFELERGAGVFAPGEGAEACYLVVRGALEIFVVHGKIQRRISLAGPGELVGYLSVIEGTPHAAAARVREGACLLEIKAARFRKIYSGDSAASVALQHAIHRSLLRALGRTNTQLTRLISHARLGAEGADALELEKALHGQIVQSDGA